MNIWINEKIPKYKCSKPKGVRIFQQIENGYVRVNALERGQ